MNGKRISGRKASVCENCSIFVLLPSIPCAGVDDGGTVFSTGEERFSVENIYGETIELYGDGIYRYNSVLKAGINKGTNLVMLLVALAFALFTARRRKGGKNRYIHVGLLAGLLYYSSCLVFGVTFNALFPVYVLQFSASLFAMIFLVADLLKEEHLSSPGKQKSEGNGHFSPDQRQFSPCLVGVHNSGTSVWTAPPHDGGVHNRADLCS